MKITVVARRALPIMLFLLEGLVFPEISDGESQRIDRDQRIGYRLANHENEVRYVSFASRFDMIRAVVDLLKLHGGPERGRAQVFNGDTLDLNFYFFMK